MEVDVCERVVCCGMGFGMTGASRSQPNRQALSTAVVSTERLSGSRKHRNSQSQMLSATPFTLLYAVSPCTKTRSTIILFLSSMAHLPLSLLTNRCPPLPGHYSGITI
ncbi:hypothetical protein TRVL_05467 [Trypanosoma vivax]|nr:hypothetical protein TRVL_05467 [Trypanosoma vivax]